MKTVAQLKKLTNRTVLVRVDFNVPLQGRKVADDFKIKAAVPTVRHLLKQGARVILISHLGRPQGQDKSLSLKPVANHLEKIMGRKVEFVKDYNKIAGSKAKLILLENIRFDERESSGEKTLAKELAAWGDYFVFDAFGVAHRQDASVYYLPNYLPSYAGFNFVREIESLQLLNKPLKGLKVAVMGGAKISTKLKLIKKILPRVDFLLLGGGLANNFLRAMDWEIGRSIYEPAMVAACADLFSRKIILPVDVVVSSRGRAVVRPVSGVKAQELIYDLGPETIKYYKEIIKQAKLIIWNGPLGRFEQPGFEKGSCEIALAIAASQAKQVVGGGETLQVVNDLGIAPYLYHVSTGGGAMLEYLEGEKFPVIKKLNKN